MDDGLPLRTTINVFKVVAAVSIVGGLALTKWEPVVVALIASVTVMLANDMLKKSQDFTGQNTTPREAHYGPTAGGYTTASPPSGEIAVQPPEKQRGGATNNLRQRPTTLGLAVGDGEPTAPFHGKLYNEEDFRFIKPNTSQDVMQQIM